MGGTGLLSTARRIFWERREETAVSSFGGLGIFYWLGLVVLQLTIFVDVAADFLGHFPIFAIIADFRSGANRASMFTQENKKKKE